MITVRWDLSTTYMLARIGVDGRELVTVNRDKGWHDEPHWTEIGVNWSAWGRQDGESMPSIVAAFKKAQRTIETMALPVVLFQVDYQGTTERIQRDFAAPDKAVVRAMFQHEGIKVYSIKLVRELAPAWKPKAKPAA